MIVTLYVALCRGARAVGPAMLPKTDWPSTRPETGTNAASATRTARAKSTERILPPPARQEEDRRDRGACRDRDTDEGPVRARRADDVRARRLDSARYGKAGERGDVDRGRGDGRRVVRDRLEDDPRTARTLRGLELQAQAGRRGRVHGEMFQAPGRGREAALAAEEGRPPGGTQL